MLRRRIGQRVFLLRSQRKMTALELAARAHVHRNTIYRVESALNLPSVGQLWRIARALGVGVEELVREECVLRGAVGMIQNENH